MEWGTEIFWHHLFLPFGNNLSIKARDCKLESENKFELALDPEDVHICGQIDEDFHPLIYGGKTLQRGTSPWLVAINTKLSDLYLFKCGGVLISHSIVLTAAHCIVSGSEVYSPLELRVFVGRYQIIVWPETFTQKHYVDKIIPHPEYRLSSSSMDADIAVLILIEPVIYNKYVRPICLWNNPNNFDKIVGIEGKVTGWGRQENGALSEIPKEVFATIVSDSTCVRTNYAFGLFTTRRNFCAGNSDESGPCTGDSGGPFAIYKDERWILRGLVANALTKSKNFSCDLSKYVIYTDVAKFIPWIRTVSKSP